MELNNNSIILQTFSIYKHWLYQSLDLVHVVPASHCVGPVHPFPPHCPHLTAVPPDAELVAGAAVVVVCVAVAVAVAVGVGVVPELHTLGAHSCNLL